jgi:hypothetical protein
MAAGYRLQHGCNARDPVHCNVRQPIHRMLAPASQKGTQTMTDRNTVVVKDGGSGAGMILGIIAVNAIVAAIWFFAIGPGSVSKSCTKDGGTTINVEVPSMAPNPS